MPHVLSKAIAVATLGFAAVASAEAPKAAAHDRTLDRGRYLVRIGGCNDCHTPHYPEKAGLVPESEWLTGVPVGIQGPWGTTYPANLRRAMQGLTEAQWLTRARQPMRPPMPWFALRDMSDADLRAIYRYVKSLGPKGEPVPAYVPPGGSVTTPYMDWSVRSPAGAPPKPGQ